MEIADPREPSFGFSVDLSISLLYAINLKIFDLGRIESEGREGVLYFESDKKQLLGISER